MENQIRSRDAKIVPIGNSKGVRIPKALLQKYGLKNSLLILFSRMFVTMP
jgi:antitoxin MazE